MRAFADMLASIVVGVGSHVVRRAGGKSGVIILAIGAALLFALLAAITQKPSPSLRSSPWLLIEWNGRPVAGRPYIKFGRADTFDGRGICERFGGRWSMIGGIISLKQTHRTREECEGAELDLEGRFQTDLSRVVRFDIGKDGNLAARDADNIIVFRFRPATRREID